MSGKVVFDQELCKGCEVCVDVCPRGIIYMAEGRNQRGYRPAEVKDMDRCTGCAICAQMCPDCVIQVFRKPPEKDADAAGDARAGRSR